jgi:CheY-like chemotaxis protein
LKILLVDDIVINRYIIKELVKKEGHIPVEAENGKKAIELIQNDHFDLIFMDIEMPVMNGIETVHYIRTKLPSPKNKIKIFALTAYNPSLLHEEFNTSEFDGIVSKPFSTEKIKCILNSVLNKSNS